MGMQGEIGGGGGFVKKCRIPATAYASMSPVLVVISQMFSANCHAGVWRIDCESVTKGPCDEVTWWLSSDHKWQKVIHQGTVCCCKKKPTRLRNWTQLGIHYKGNGIVQPEGEGANIDFDQ